MLKTNLLILCLYVSLLQVESKEWTTVDDTTATVLVGVGANNGWAVAAASSNGVGAYMEMYNGKDWTKVTSQYIFFLVH